MISLERIRNHEATVGIIGLGYVGLPLAAEFAAKHFPTIGFDIDPSKVDNLLAGRSYIRHIGDKRIIEMRENGFLPTTDYTLLNECDAILMCVPTPLNRNREPDLSYVISSTRSVREHLCPGQLVVLESTTYPGTTDEVLKPILEETGLVVGRDVYLAFSPEREDPNNKQYNTATIPKVVGGYSATCLELACALYDQIVVRTVPVSSTATAEAVKILENTYRSINIALVNELKILCLRMGMDIHEVIRAAATKPFGFMPFYPGPGLGGHCIPIDPFYLTSKAREYDISTRFIELAGEINTAMPYFVIQRVMEALNDHGKALKGAKVLLLGAAYKKNVDDDRESPSYKLMELLAQKGAEISYNDPHIPVLRRGRKYDFGLTSTQLTEASLAQADCILIATDHDAYDPAFILQHAQLIVDTRNIIPVSPVSVGKLYKA